jgi:hypothetical protein
MLPFAIEFLRGINSIQCDMFHSNDFEWSCIFDLICGLEVCCETSENKTVGLLYETKSGKKLSLQFSDRL